MCEHERTRKKCRKCMDWFLHNCFIRRYASSRCCSVLQCVAVCCSVLQCVAACCSASIGFDTTVWYVNMPRLYVGTHVHMNECPHISEDVQIRLIDAQMRHIDAQMRHIDECTHESVNMPHLWVTMPHLCVTMPHLCVTMPHLFVKWGVFICLMCVHAFIKMPHLCVGTHSCVCHNSFICSTWFSMHICFTLQYTPLHMHKRRR